MTTAASVAAPTPLQAAAALYLGRYFAPVPEADSPDLVAALGTAEEAPNRHLSRYWCAACGRWVGNLASLYQHLRGAPHIARLYGVDVAALRLEAVPC